VSDHADSTAVVLPESRDSSTRTYKEHVGPLWRAMGIIKVLEVPFSMAALMLIIKAPAAALALAPQPHIITVASHRLPLMAFVALLFARLIMFDPLAYHIGKRSMECEARSTERQPRHWFIERIIKLLQPIWRRLEPRLKRLLEKLQNANHKVVLGVLFLLRCFAVPFTGYINPYGIAGISAIHFGLVMGVDVLATCACIIVYHYLGQVIDLGAIIGSLF
jgi:hypothetical protein